MTTWRSARCCLACAWPALLLLVPACDDATTPGSDPLSQTLTSAHYVYHLAQGDAVDTTWQERYLAWLMPALDLQFNSRLDYFKYRNRSHITALTGRATNGYAEPGTTRFHTIWPTDNHEAVHALVILLMGHPPALFNEGVAVAHQTLPPSGILTPRWSGQDVHVLARQFDATGRLPSLDQLVASTSFFQFDTNVTYPMAGSFVRYLIDTHGLATFKVFLRNSRFDAAPTQTESAFQTAYGRSISAVWTEWRSWLRGP
ncbi:MAG: hypothetical protein ACRENP_12300 [Longimicrobiales bacterium]